MIKVGYVKQVITITRAARQITRSHANVSYIEEQTNPIAFRNGPKYRRFRYRCCRPFRSFVGDVLVFFHKTK